VVLVFTNLIQSSNDIDCLVDNFLLCKHAQTGYTKWLGNADFWDEVQILKLADASGSW
jgi:hypothetical protein